MNLPEFKSEEEMKNYLEELSKQYEIEKEAHEVKEKELQKVTTERDTLKDTNARYLEKLIVGGGKEVIKEAVKEDSNKKKKIYKLSE